MKSTSPFAWAAAFWIGLWPAGLGAHPSARSQLESVTGRLGVDAPGPIETPQAAVLGPKSSYSLRELEQLGSGPHREYARVLFKDLAASGWPPELVERLREAGVRVSFDPPGDARVEWASAGLYDPLAKTLRVWEAGWLRSRKAVVAELAHAVSDLMEPDDPRKCVAMMSQRNVVFRNLWLAYIERVNRHMGTAPSDGKVFIYPREFLSRRFWDSVLPWRWLEEHPSLGGQGYLNPEEYWMEGVIHFFSDRERLARLDRGLHDFVAATLEEVVQNGLPERVGHTPSMGHCFKPEPQPFPLGG